MSQPVISVEGLGKRYYLSHEKREDTLRDSVTKGVRGLWSRLTKPGTGQPEGEEFWALRNASFEVKQGEVVGVIGRNGAGKSTLLKILSRITDPTTGRAVIWGRVASLLEVGTGFHPELSGRENIYLNGAILGMSRSEITRKFDEIVAFAEVERFLDTQVKHYSSGMYVRLAFAVAAHLEPEILIIDEVLAVGDLAFQNKCLGKMQQVAGGGRTVLFVSHNLAAVQHLCSRCLYLNQGALSDAGPSALVIQRYLADVGTDGADAGWKFAQRDADLEIEAVELLVNGEPRAIVPAGATVTLRASYCCSTPARFPDGLECGFVIYGQGQKLVNFWSNAGLGRGLPATARGVITCTVPAWPFRTMPMSVHLHLNYHLANLVELQDALAFDSADSDRFGTGIVPHASEGILLLPHTWATQPALP